MIAGKLLWTNLMRHLYLLVICYSHTHIHCQFLFVRGPHWLAAILPLGDFSINCVASNTDIDSGDCQLVRSCHARPLLGHRTFLRISISSNGSCSGKHLRVTPAPRSAIMPSEPFCIPINPIIPIIPIIRHIPYCPHFPSPSHRRPRGKGPSWTAQHWADLRSPSVELPWPAGCGRGVRRAGDGWNTFLDGVGEKWSLRTPRTPILTCHWLQYYLSHRNCWEALSEAPRSCVQWLLCRLQTRRIGW